MSTASLTLGIYTLVCHPLLASSILAALGFLPDSPIYRVIVPILWVSTALCSVYAIAAGIIDLKEHRINRDGKSIAGIVLGAFYIFFTIFALVVMYWNGGLQ